MRLVVVTGMSGAGKSVALRTLEDAGFEAIDNLPLAFLPNIVKAATDDEHLAIGVDIRGRDFTISRFQRIIAPLRSEEGVELTVIFLDSNDEVLIRRYTETRRRHPLAADRPLLDGILHERELIEGLKTEADLVVDTSELLPAELKRLITASVAGAKQRLSLLVTSFSFRHGVPREADTVIDVRFLDNPHYVEDLRPLTGLDKPVGEYIMQDKDFANFYEGLTHWLLPLLPRYMQEGKSYLTLAVGCTGGRHRSVFVAERLSGDLRANGFDVVTRHRDTWRK